MRIDPGKEIRILCCVLAGALATSVAMVAHGAIWVRFPPTGSAGMFFAKAALVGIPAFGGGPFWVHLFNAGVWGAWGGLAYGLCMRMLFGSVQIGRLAVLFGLGLAAVAIGGQLAILGIVSAVSLGYLFLAGYAVAGLFVVRDWPSGERRATGAVARD